jgi:hypothetical protein
MQSPVSFRDLEANGSITLSGIGSSAQSSVSDSSHEGAVN